MRYSLGNVLGLTDEDPNKELFFMGKTLDTSKKIPNIGTTKI
jgi:hypothetical protein